MKKLVIKFNFLQNQAKVGQLNLDLKRRSSKQNDYKKLIN